MDWHYPTVLAHLNIATVLKPHDNIDYAPLWLMLTNGPSGTTIQCHHHKASVIYGINHTCIVPLNFKFKHFAHSLTHKMLRSWKSLEGHLMWDSTEMEGLMCRRQVSCLQTKGLEKAASMTGHDYRSLLTWDDLMWVWVSGRIHGTFRLIDCFPGRDDAMV